VGGKELPKNPRRQVLMVEEAARSCCVVLAKPPVRTRFPLSVHLAAEMRTCWCSVMERWPFSLSQIDRGEPCDEVGGGVRPNPKTRLGRAGEAALDA
jgi:hypothetical protein